MRDMITRTRSHELSFTPRGELSEAKVPVSTLLGTHRNIDSGMSDPPTWSIYVLVALVSTGVVTTILLYLVNFPPEPFTVGKRQNHRFEYYRLEDCDPDPAIVIGGSRSTSLSSSTSSSRYEPDAQAAQPTSAYTSALHARRRRDRLDKLNLDIKARPTGLGIAFQGNAHPSCHSEDQPLRHPIASLDNDSLGKPASEHPSSAAAAAAACDFQTLTAPLATTDQNSFLPSSSSRRLTTEVAARELGSRLSDILEDGLLHWRAGMQGPQGSEASSPSLYIRGSDIPRSSSLRTTTGALMRVGDGLESAVAKLARILHQQVKKDPEEGLLLPVRDGERE